MSTATSDYLNLPCRSLAEVLRTRALSGAMPPIGDLAIGDLVLPASSPAIVATRISP
jgi:hypothetical protein